MSSTTALFTGLSGVIANSRMLDVIGNNIANVNTNGYKANRMSFAPTFSRTFSLGTAPSTVTGGSNPGQVGLGVSIAGTQRDTRNGAVTVTGGNTDLAINGNGYFVLDANGQQVYSRNGSFGLNSINELTSIGGARVMGYGVDSDFNIQAGSLQALSIPIGSMTIAQATENVSFTGNLDANGTIGTVGSLTTMAALNALAGATPPPANPPFADGTTRLVDLNDGAGNPQFVANDIVRLTGAEKGGTTLPDADLVVDATTTIADLMTFLEQSLGIDTSRPGEPGGVSIDATTGVLSIEGNIGAANDLDISTSDLIQLDSLGAPKDQPFVATTVNESDGESVRTSTIVYDSLGTAVRVDLIMALESRSNTGTTWRYYAESPDSVGLDLGLGTGTIDFGTDGKVLGAADFDVTIDRSNTGAATPLVITMSMMSGGHEVSSFGDAETEITAVFQDGSPVGTLADFAIGGDGVISGVFSNGLLRTLGQIAMATFTNDEGLVDTGDQFYQTGPNSGPAVISTPLNFGGGSIQSGAVELSNVDLGEEFISMILASTGYSASTRIITTANDLIQQLLVIGR